MTNQQRRRFKVFLIRRMKDGTVSRKVVFTMAVSKAQAMRFAVRRNRGYSVTQVRED